MTKKKLNISISELGDEFSKLPKGQAKRIINKYAKVNKEPDFAANFKEINLSELENKLEELNINSSCPSCGSPLVVKNGKTENGLQRYKCTCCNFRFNRFTGTFLEKTKFDWDTWIEFVFMTLNNFSIKKIQRNLESNYDLLGIDIKTIWGWRHKIMSVVLEVNQPVLVGVIQIDETHLHEAQKGSRELVNLYDNKEVRDARYRGKKAKYGVMGAEFVTIICAIDETGHVVSKVSGLGKFDFERFVELFQEHLQRISVLCTDGNNVYSRFAEKNGILHYVRPSDYLEKIKGRSEEELKVMYENGEIDYVAKNYGRLNYTEFLKFKEKYHPHLNSVNGYHTQFKDKCKTIPRGISVEYVDEYASWLAFLTNWNIDNGKVPTTKNDAESILKFLLTQQVNPLLKEIREKKPTTLIKPSSRFLKNLKKNTDKIREKKPYFVYDTETLGDGFGIRDQLETLPLFILKEMGKDLKIIGYSRAKRDYCYRLKRELEKHPQIKEELLKMRAKYGKDKFSEDNS